MKRNVEVKVRVEDVGAILKLLPGLSAEDRGMLRQADTYFGTPEPGTRLKIREQEPGGAELISYSRPDISGLRTSAYQVCKLTDPAPVREALTAALGVKNRIVKTRRLFLVGRTRVHLDHVEGHGEFLELEVVLAPDEDERSGEREAERILLGLGLDRAPRIAGSYADL